MLCDTPRVQSIVAASSHGAANEGRRSLPWSSVEGWWKSLYRLCAGTCTCTCTSPRPGSAGSPQFERAWEGAMYLCARILTKLGGVGVRSTRVTGFVAVSTSAEGSGPKVRVASPCPSVELCLFRGLSQAAFPNHGGRWTEANAVPPILERHYYQVRSEWKGPVETKKGNPPPSTQMCCRVIPHGPTGLQG